MNQNIDITAIIASGLKLVDLKLVDLKLVDLKLVDRNPVDMGAYGLAGANWGVDGVDLGGILGQVAVVKRDVSARTVRFKATCQTKESAPMASMHQNLAHMAAMKPHGGPAAGKQDPGG